MELSNYAFLGLTKSLCPQCLSLVDAKIISRRGRVYFRKRCDNCGPREDFVCSDVRYYDQLQYVVPGKIPPHRFAPVRNGCPFDCGLCEDHEQHSCIALIELTDNCNLSCPMCFASSGPGAKHRSWDEIVAAIDRIVEAEGRPEVVQLSGGEPTLHPRFDDVVRYACQQPIDYVMVNTNGIRLAKDAQLVERLALQRERLEVFLQFDGFDDRIYRELRGEPLLDLKLRALDRLEQVGVNVTLAVTLQAGVNEHEVARIVNFAATRRGITAINFQPATYSGRYVLPETLENRVTFPDVIKSIEAGCDEQFKASDFMPLPCAHPNCHSLSVAYRHQGRLVPVSRFIDLTQHYDLLANGIAFTRERSRQLMMQYLNRLASGCGSSGCCGEAGPEETTGTGTDFASLDAEPRIQQAATEFLERAMNRDLGANDLLRITITSFLDAFNFDVRRVMKCCTHHVLPSGHIIPFCAYNVLYREGHVALPSLVDAASPVQITTPLGEREVKSADAHEGSTEPDCGSVPS